MVWIGQKNRGAYWNRMVACTLLLSLGFGIRAHPDQAPGSKPNIVILFADDLGFGDLGCYGHPTIKTPNLDAMARDGVRLTEFYAARSCSPSRALLMTGRYSHRNGVTHVLGPDSDDGLPPSEITLAEALRDAGYRTAMFGKWHLGSAESRHRPLANGFDEYFGLLYSNDMIPPWVKTDRPLHLWEGDEPTSEHPVNQATLTKRCTERAVDFIRRAKDDPFFLYMPYSMVHLPIHASEAFAGRSEAGPYGDVVEEIDWSVGRILKALEEEAIDEHTLVVFTSDNGPWLDLPERMLAGGVESWHAGSPGLLRGRKGTTYEGGARVPCIVRWPGQIPAGRTTTGIASVMDLFATAVALGDVNLPEGHVLDGVDIMPFLSGQAPSPRVELFHYRSRYPEALRMGPWKFRIRATRDADETGPQLFHLLRDPSERFNVAGRYPDTLERLQRRMEAFIGEIRSSTER